MSTTKNADTEGVARIIRRRYRFCDSFTVNDLRPLIGAEGMQLTPHGTGAVFQQLRKKGLIEKTGHYVTSTNPKSRDAVVAIWRRVRPVGAKR